MPPGVYSLTFTARVCTQILQVCSCLLDHDLGCVYADLDILFIGKVFPIHIFFSSIYLGPTVFYICGTC